MDLKTLQERTFEWLCKSDKLQEIERQCREHVGDIPKGKLVYRFVISINILDLLDFDAYLGNIALHTPLKLIPLLQEVYYELIGTLKWIQDVTCAAQILVVPRFSSVPVLPEYSSADRKGLMNSTRFHNGTFSIQGVVCAITGVTQYTQSARFYCPVSTCHGSSRCCYIRVNLAGMTEALTTGKTFTCKYCESTLEEDATCRILSDKCIIHIISSESLTCKTWINSNNVLARYQTVPVYLRDELTKLVVLGGLYRFTVCYCQGSYNYSADIPTSTPVFEANNIEKVGVSLIDLQIRCKSLPDCIRDLFEDRRESPWSFAASITYCFGEPIVRPGSFMHLKMGLLMSLVLLEQSDDDAVKGLDVLALAQDLLPVQRLLLYASSFAGRLVAHSAICDLVASVSRDPSGTGTYIVNAGSMLLAKNGICLLSNINTLKKENKENLRKAMENRKEMIEIPKRFTECASHLSVPMNCSVWTCSEPFREATKGKMMESWDQLPQINSNQYAGAETQALINQFGLVFSLPNCENNDVLSLQRAMVDDTNAPKDIFIPEEDISKFIQFVSHRKIHLGQSPQKLIQSFYLAGRRARSLQGDFPLSSFQTITSLAAAHAKLSLRDQVIDEDVVTAVLLFDNSLQVSHGYSLLGFQHNSPSAPTILSNDSKMRDYQRIIYCFCSKYKTHGSFTVKMPHEE